MAVNFVSGQDMLEVVSLDGLPSGVALWAVGRILILVFSVEYSWKPPLYARALKIHAMYPCTQLQSLRKLWA